MIFKIVQFSDIIIVSGVEKKIKHSKLFYLRASVLKCDNSKILFRNRKYNRKIENSSY